MSLLQSLNEFVLFRNRVDLLYTYIEFLFSITRPAAQMSQYIFTFDNESQLNSEICEHLKYGLNVLPITRNDYLQTTETTENV